MSHFYTHQSYALHLNDALDAGDGGVEQSADSLIIVHVVCISNAHEDDVSRQPGNEADCYAARLQI